MYCTSTINPTYTLVRGVDLCGNLEYCETCMLHTKPPNQTADTVSLEFLNEVPLSISPVV